MNAWMTVYPYMHTQVCIIMRMEGASMERNAYNEIPFNVCICLMTA